MPALTMIITDAGLDALVDAENGETDAIQIASIGLTDTIFVTAPTLTALPGQHKLIDTLSGQSVADNIIHITAYDFSADLYDVTGFGIYLDDGTLFAVYSSADEPILSKAELAFSLFSIDIAFSNDAGALIEFGNALFSYPPATETVKGIAKIATQVRVNAVADGADDFETIVTPKTLRARLAAFLIPITASLDSLLAGLGTVTANLAALTARTITGSGLVTGGGNLTASRVLTVTALSGAEIAAGTENGKAATALSIASVPQSFGSSFSILGLGGAITKGGRIFVNWATPANVVFPVAFPNACDGVTVIATYNRNGGDEADEYFYVTEGSISAAGFTITTSGDGENGTMMWIAHGH